MGYIKRLQDIKVNKILKIIKRNDGFGLVETVISLAFLTLLTSYSLYFISARLKIIFDSNITNAVNDEIRRDIEKIKSELWADNFNPSSNGNLAFYDTNLKSCRNIDSRIKSLPSWEPSTWLPGSNKNSVEGQIRNKVLSGGGVYISRSVTTSRPLYKATDDSLDFSIAQISYRVKTKDFDKLWTVINLSNEAYSWCPPSS